MRKFCSIIRLRNQIRKERNSIASYEKALYSLKEKYNLGIVDIPHLLEQYTKDRQRKLDWLEKELKRITITE